MDLLFDVRMRSTLITPYDIWAISSMLIQKLNETFCQQESDLSLGFAR